jgi:TPR repeat protein
MDAITGIGSSENDALGIDYFRRSAELGYGPGQIALAYYYETGTAVASNPGQAIELYRKAAQQGDPLAGWLTGRHYFLGIGVPRDLDVAQKWFKLSADQNNAFGAYYLGRLMADKDATKAPKLYKIAADQGLPQAQYFYAKALKDGRGIAQDRFTAYIWYSIAADAGYTAAIADLNEIDRPRSGTSRHPRCNGEGLLRMGWRVCRISHSAATKTSAFLPLAPDPKPAGHQRPTPVQFPIDHADARCRAGADTDLRLCPQLYPKLYPPLYLQLCRPQPAK